MIKEIHREIKTPTGHVCGMLNSLIFDPTENLKMHRELWELREFVAHREKKIISRFRPVALLNTFDLVFERYRRRGFGTLALQEFVVGAIEKGANLALVCIGRWEGGTLKQNVVWFEDRGFVRLDNDPQATVTFAYKILGAPRNLTW